MSESVKRSIGDIDPDYRDLADQQAKRQRVIEKDAQQASVDTIRRIVNAQFEEELQLKEEAAKEADKRLNEARIKMDRLRAVIVASFYSRQQQDPGKGQNYSAAPAPSIHPTAKRHLGKAPVGTSADTKKSSAPQSAPSSVLSHASVSTANAEKSGDSTERKGSGSSRQSSHSAPAPSVTPLTATPTQDDYRLSLQRTIIVGNCSRFLLPHQRQPGNPSTHKWMVYVRGSRDSPNISDIVSKVWFFLHPSYRPHDLVEIKEPPYHLSRQGWGEFPVRVQLHFRDTRNKRMDIIHNLVLDKTYTGLQTLGAETVVSVDLVRDPTPCPPRSSQSSIPDTSDHVVIEAAVKNEPAITRTSTTTDNKTQECQCGTPNADCVCVLRHRDTNVTSQENQIDAATHSRQQCQCAALNNHSACALHNRDKNVTSREQQVDTATHNKQHCQCAALNTADITCVCAPDKTTSQGRPAHQGGGNETLTVKEEPPDEGGVVCSCPQSADARSDQVIKQEPCDDTMSTSQANSASQVGSENPRTVPSQKISDPTEQTGVSLLSCVKQEASDETQSISHGSNKTMHNSSRVVDTAITSKETVDSAQQNQVSLLSCPPAKPPSAVSGSQVSLLSNTLPTVMTVGSKLPSVPVSTKVVVMGASGPVSRTVNSGAVSLLRPAQVAAKPIVGMSAALPLMKVTAQGLRPLRPPVASAPPPLKFVVNCPPASRHIIPRPGPRNPPPLTPNTPVSSQSISLLANNNLPRLTPIANSPSVSNQSIPVLRASTPPLLKPMIVKSPTVGSQSILPSAALSAKPQVQARSSSGTGQGPVMKSLLKTAPKPGIQVTLQQSSASTPRSVQSNPETSALTHSSLTSVPQHTLVSPSSSSPCIVAKMNKKNILVQLGPGQTNQNVKSTNDLTQSQHVDEKIVVPPKQLGQFKTPVRVKVMSSTADAPTDKVMPSTTTTLSFKVMPSTVTAPTVKLIPTTTTSNHQRHVPDPGTTVSFNPIHRTVPTNTASLVSGNSDTTIPAHYPGHRSRAGLELERAKASLEVSRSAQLAKLKALADKKLVVGELPPPRPRSTRWFSQGMGGEGDQGCVNRGGQKGITMALVKQEGVSVSGVNESGVKVDEFTMSKVKQEGVTVSGVKHEGVSTTGIKPEGVSESGFKQFRVMSEVKQEGVTATLDRGPEQLQAVSGSVMETEKKIMVFKKMKTSGWLEQAVAGSPIPSLSLKDYTNLSSLVKAAILRHPLLAPSTEKMVHPYCARSLDQWTTWHPAKRNAAEWSRAAAVRRYLQAYLDGANSFKGEQLWSTKRIMVWCRLHGLSPNKPGGRPLSESVDRTEPPDLQYWDNKLVSSSDFHLLSSLFHPEDKKDVCTEDRTEVEVMDVDAPPHKTRRRVKEETVHVGHDLHFDCLPSTAEAQFVQDTAAQVGVKFAPAVVAPGMLSSTAEDILFGAMLEFAGDLLHHACVGPLSSPSHSSSPIVTAREIVQATSTLPAASFLGNRYCGLPNTPASPTKR